jgi:hypothetical protein
MSEDPKETPQPAPVLLNRKEVEAALMGRRET